jgi:hypothetical protein
MSKNLLLLLLVMLLSERISAQLFEVGPSIGVNSILGDEVSQSLLDNSEMGFGFIFKYNRNYRLAYRINYHYLPTVYTEESNLEKSQISIHELAAGVEFNFFDYQKPYGRHNSTPYLLAELGLASFNNQTRVSIPVGIGFKTKLFTNIAVAFEARAQYVFGDNIEGDPTAPNSEPYTQNLNSRNDWYIFTGLNIVYTFGRQNCYTRPM